MNHKKRKTKFESFSQRFLIVSIVIFMFGIIGVKSMDSTYNRQIQRLQHDIKTIRSDIDSLELQKQQLAAFPRLNEVANTKGYTYNNSTVAASTTTVEE